MLQSSEQKNHFFPEIEGLRAIAVIIVILFHAEISVFSGGFVGVDVFFVISGFLITSLLLREQNKKSKIDLGTFFARRAKRLLPASFFVTIVTMLAFSQVYSALEIKMLTSSAIASLVYLSNIWFASISTDYLQGGADADPFLHMWSLAVEEQFYLFWPILIVLAYKFIKDGSKLWAIFLLVVCLTFMLNLSLINTHQPWAFFGAPTRAWEFGAGAMCSMAAWQRPLKIGSYTSTTGMTVGLLLLGYAVFNFDIYTIFPGYNALLPVVGTALILLIITNGQTTLWSKLLASTPMTFIGGISYSWYLWHWPAKVFAKEVFSDFGKSAILASVVLAFFFAIFTTRFIENPVRKLSNLKNNYIFFTTILFTALTLGLFGLIRMDADKASQMPLQKKFQAAQNDLAPIYAAGCHADYQQIESKGCRFGDLDANRVIVLFGDSHAAHWFGAIERFSLKAGFKLVVHTKSGCPSFIIEPFDTSLGRFYHECTIWRENVFKKIKELDPTLVLVSNHDTYWNSRFLKNDLTKNINEAYQQLFDTLSSPTLVIKNIGAAHFSIPKCLARTNSEVLTDSSTCNFLYQEDTAVTDPEKTVIGKLNEGRYIDLNKIICPNTICMSMTGNRINYIDNNHLSHTYSQSLYEPLRDEIIRLNILNIP